MVATVCLRVFRIIPKKKKKERDVARSSNVIARKHLKIPAIKSAIKLNFTFYLRLVFLPSAQADAAFYFIYFIFSSSSYRKDRKKTVHIQHKRLFIFSSCVSFIVSCVDLYNGYTMFVCSFFFFFIFLSVDIESRCLNNF